MLQKQWNFLIKVSCNRCGQGWRQKFALNYRFRSACAFSTFLEPQRESSLESPSETQSGDSKELLQPNKRIQAVVELFAQFQTLVRCKRKLITNEEKGTLLEAFNRNDDNFTILEGIKEEEQQSFPRVDDYEELTTDEKGRYLVKKAVSQFKQIYGIHFKCPTKLTDAEMNTLVKKPFVAKQRYLRRLYEEEVGALMRRKEIMPLPREIYTPSVVNASEEQLNFILDLFESNDSIVSSTLTLEDFEVLNDKTRSGALKYFQKLFVLELSALTKEVRKRLLKQNKGTSKIEWNKMGDRLQNMTEYGLWRNSLFIRVDRGAQLRFGQRNLLHASLHGQRLVFDFSYENHMSSLETSSLCKHIWGIIAYNRKRKDAYDLWFCNYDHKSCAHLDLKKLDPDIDQPSSFVNIREQSYLEVFPKEKLVYLSPDSENVLLDYDHSAVYIIGAFVDVKLKRGMSLAKATEEGIATARLPIQEYIKLRQHSCLALTWLVQAMQKAKETNGDWEKALRELPKELILPGKPKTAITSQNEELS